MGAGTSAGEFHVERPLVASGFVDALADDVSVHALPSASSVAFELRASSAHLELQWQAGTSVRSASGGELVRHRADEGAREWSFQAVTAVDEGPSMELLGLPSDDGSAASARGVGDVVHPERLPTHVTRVGAAPDVQSTGGTPRLSFWYEPDPAHVLASGLDAAVLTGDLTLFVNNATLTLREGGEVVWHDWTGYREEEVAPFVHRFEQRLLFLHLTNATLTVAAEDGVRLLAPTLDVTTTGVVRSEHARGLLPWNGRDVLFDGGPLELRGTGRIGLERATAGGPLALNVRDGSNFELAGGAALADEGPVVATSNVWLALGVVSLAFVGVLALRRTGFVRDATISWRTRRYAKWMARGRELAAGADFPTAAACFRRATRADPRQAAGWYHLTVATLETGDYARTLEVVDEVRKSGAAVDPLDLLEVEAEAAQKGGAIERCRAALTALLDESEEMAAGLARDLELEDDVLGPELAARLRRHDTPTGGLPGYG